MREKTFLLSPSFLSRSSSPSLSSSSHADKLSVEREEEEGEQWVCDWRFKWLSKDSRQWISRETTSNTRQQQLLVQQKDQTGWQDREWRQRMKTGPTTIVVTILSVTAFFSPTEGMKTEEHDMKDKRTRCVRSSISFISFFKTRQSTWSLCLSLKLRLPPSSWSPPLSSVPGIQWQSWTCISLSPLFSFLVFQHCSNPIPRAFWLFLIFSHSSSHSYFVPFVTLKRRDRKRSFSPCSSHPFSSQKAFTRLNLQTFIRVAKALKYSLVRD